MPIPLTATVAVPRSVAVIVRVTDCAAPSWVKRTGEGQASTSGASCATQVKLTVTRGLLRQPGRHAVGERGDAVAQEGAADGRAGTARRMEPVGVPAPGPGPAAVATSESGRTDRPSVEPACLTTRVTVALDAASRDGSAGMNPAVTAYAPGRAGGRPSRRAARSPPGCPAP